MKALCVHLNKDDFNTVKAFCSEARYKNLNMTEHAITCIQRSRCSSYCQIPFSVCDEPCQVVDLRPSAEVTQQLINFICSGEADVCWVPK